MLKLGICFGDGVVTYDKLFGERADSRQLVTFLKHPRFNRMADLLH